jgi:UDP-2,4-diacetamido-2,4,6-trideoxy-beta-L-altropyranose hydrolase
MARVVFRCDASPAIGGGHVARCMALAHALRRRGADVELVTRELPARLRELLVEPAGCVVRELPGPDAAQGAAPDAGQPLAHADWLSVPQATDAAQTTEALRSGGYADWLVVDHYALDARWERAVQPFAGKRLVIDDLADREHACDALLDQNFFLKAESRYASLVPPSASLMLGPKYALLREEFGAARAQIGERTGALRRIFMCFGGFDGAKQTLRALQAIEAAEIDDVAVDVVIGSDHSQRRQIEAFSASRRAHRVHLDAANVAELMTPADLAIGASGIMNWERAALRLPAIVASVAENQHTVARDLAADRACIYLGFADDWSVETLAGLLRGLRGTPSLMRALSARAAELTDGHGARRVAARLLPPQIDLRRAAAAECDALHAWRNTEESRRYSGNTQAIPLEQHREWFRRVIGEPRVALLVGEHAGSPVGVLRYDVDGTSATISVYLAPGLHGQGFGTALLHAGTHWMREHHPNVTQLRAEVRRDNAASLEAFANAGYTVKSSIYTLDVRHD